VVVAELGMELTFSSSTEPAQEMFNAALGSLKEDVPLRDLAPEMHSKASVSTWNLVSSPAAVRHTLQRPVPFIDLFQQGACQ
jgi:hypothetical protein